MCDAQRLDSLFKDLLFVGDRRDDGVTKGELVILVPPCGSVSCLAVPSLLPAGDPAGQLARAEGGGSGGDEAARRAVRRGVRGDHQGDRAPAARQPRSPAHEAIPRRCLRLRLHKHGRFLQHPVTQSPLGFLPGGVPLRGFCFSSSRRSPSPTAPSPTASPSPT